MPAWENAFEYDGCRRGDTASNKGMKFAFPASNWIALRTRVCGCLYVDLGPPELPSLRCAW